MRFCYCKTLQELLSCRFIHILLLRDTLLCFFYIKAIHITVIYLLQKLVGRKEDHIITIPLRYNIRNIGSNMIIFQFAASRVTACDITCQKQLHLFLMKCRACIHFKIFLRSA